MEETKEIKESKSFLTVLFTRLKIPLTLLTHQSKLCLHPNGCIENMLKTAVNSFKYGYIFRTAISLIGALLQLKNGQLRYHISITFYHIHINIYSIAALITALIGKENWNFGFYVASYPLINKAILCFLRYYREKNDGKQDFIAGGNI